MQIVCPVRPGVESSKAAQPGQLAVRAGFAARTGDRFACLGRKSGPFLGRKISPKTGRGPFSGRKGCRIALGRVLIDDPSRCQITPDRMTYHLSQRGHVLLNSCLL